MMRRLGLWLAVVLLAVGCGVDDEMAVVGEVTYDATALGPLEICLVALDQRGATLDGSCSSTGETRVVWPRAEVPPDTATFALSAYTASGNGGGAVGTAELYSAQLVRLRLSNQLLAAIGVEPMSPKGDEKHTHLVMIATSTTSNQDGG